MRRDPTLSYRGALQILGKDDHPALDALNAVLGGMVLAAPAVGGLGIGSVAGVLGWLDRRNEALGLARRLIDGGVHRVRRLSGYQRHQLVRAAHSVIVVTALFEAVEATVGPPYRDMKITDAEKAALVAGRADPGLPLVDRLYRGDLPVPSATVGFDELAVRVLPGFYAEAVETVLRFLEGLAGWSRARRRISEPATLRQRLVSDAVARYRDRYLQLAVDVPEFLIWAGFTEHAATQRAVAGTRSELVEILGSHSRQLAQLEQLLVQVSPGPTPPRRSSVATVAMANRAVLSAPLVPAEAVRHVDGVSFPSVEEGFVTPRYRSGVHAASGRPAEESWWAGQPVRTDLDRFLAAHFSSPDSTRLPLVLLGHPGAGKSLLTRLLAARLPAEGYTVVRVPLRSVDADAPVYEQIEQALEAATHGRVNWADLTEESGASVRVVLLDGFDELLLASDRAARTGYLEQVVTFQERELSLERPVAVLVTSRTVVLDRTRIPVGCPLLQLVEFDDAAVRAWLDVWNDVNRAGIYGGRVRQVEPETVLRHETLSRQPLLLLMLTLYLSDPASALSERDVRSVADLYRSLLHNFLRRELSKDPAGLSETMIDEIIASRLWHLAIAAFGMLNRGRQRVADHELVDDLVVLLGGSAAARQGPETAERMVGQFFFVQASEATTRATTSRSYEFLHATFGEYLVAQHLVESLTELADGWRATRRTSPDADSTLLRAVLCCQPLTARRSVVTFVSEVFAALPAERRRGLADLLTNLLTHARDRAGWERPLTYRPVPEDAVRALAVYTANIVVLLAGMLASDGVDLGLPTSDGGTPLAWWRSMVRLWRAGLSDEEWDGLVGTLGVDPRGDLVLRDLEGQDGIDALEALL
ncbi:NACHT domain-containing protein [Micromonospora sp. NPDC051141]|uniref:NACHT domain-containing protein n=1 Tax=Micromonospora sp. NPDC051141 TaxID=3364284 RepID=UPI003796A165